MDTPLLYLVHRKGLVKGAKPKEVGLDERSKPRFKRNPHKAKAKRKDKNSAKEKKNPKAETGGEVDVVRVGAKRKGPAGQQTGAKRLKGTHTYTMDECRCSGLTTCM